MTLLIVDDHAGFRSFARMVLTEDGFEVTGDVADGEAALDAVRALRPDVVLLDVQLPGIDGFEVARRLAADPDPPHVVMTSSREASEYGRLLAEAPVAGFIPKEALSGEAIAEVLARA
jgi:DNA-binding NarL/FixJ family response regulator